MFVWSVCSLVACAWCVVPARGGRAVVSRWRRCLARQLPLETFRRATHARPASRRVRSDHGVYLLGPLAVGAARRRGNGSLDSEPPVPPNCLPGGCIEGSWNRSVEASRSPRMGDIKVVAPSFRRRGAVRCALANPGTEASVSLMDTAPSRITVDSRSSGQGGARGGLSCPIAENGGIGWPARWHRRTWSGWRPTALCGTNGCPSTWRAPITGSWNSWRGAIRCAASRTGRSAMSGGSI